MAMFPLFPVTTVGSWPRSTELLRAQKRKRAGALTAGEFAEVADREVVEVLRAQEEAGVDIVTDGEQRRDNFYSFVAEKLAGVRLMTLAEMLDLIEDRTGFEKILKTLEVPAYSLSNPTCVGRIERKASLAGDELAFVKRHTSKPVKVPLPGPYLLTRAMFVQEVTRSVYPTKEALADDVVRILRDEVAELIAGGADFIQFDEPVLTELAFSRGSTRTFMCASLAATGDPTRELEFAVSLLDRVLEGQPKVLTGLHVCRGKWSKNESTLLRGNYAPLKPWLERMAVDQLVLEYATERAGDVMEFAGKSLGLGVVNPRLDAIESAAEIGEQVERALALYPPERIFLNPDCGFGTFSQSPVADASAATRKLAAMVEAARALRASHGAKDRREPHG